MNTISKSSGNISVIGLGQMGSKIAEIFLEHGYQVTVWNRTSSKAARLVEKGADLASSVARAITASEVVIVCVYDYQASNTILKENGLEDVLSGKTIIQLTTGSPQEARAGESWAKGRGAHYLDGAIQVAPDQMAQPDTTILLSGPKTTFQENESILNLLGGNITYLGESIGAAATMDLATLSYVYGAIIGFIHGARISETEGLDVDTYGRIVAQMAPGVGEFFAYEANVIHAGNYEVTQSPLGISVEATERILVAAKESNINSEFPAFVSGLFKRAEKAGYGNQELAAMIKVLRGIDEPEQTEQIFN